MPVSFKVIAFIVYLAIFYLFLSATFRRYFDDRSEVLQHLGSRTPYRLRGNWNYSRPIHPGCKEKKIWMLIRHGTRLPSSKDIISIQNELQNLRAEILYSYKLGKGILSSEQEGNLKLWSFDLQPNEAKLLAFEGRDELKLLADRMQRRFPSILQDKFSNDTYSFRYTATERAQQSAKYFSIGLFGAKGSQSVWFNPAKKVDPILRFYKHCDKWQKQVKQNLTTYDEMKKYGLGSEMNESVAALSQRLGLNRTLSLESASVMYKLCGFEIAWNRHLTSPWCYGFNKAIAESFEYYYDLKHYWLDGYGHALTYKLPCLALNDMLEHFSDEKGPQASFLFAHSGTLLKLLSHIGLYRPEKPLTALHRDPNRPWRASEIDSFAANLAFVLYRCEDKEDYLLTMHQEKTVRLSYCPGELCPLRLFKEKFRDTINNCDFADLCR